MPLKTGHIVKPSKAVIELASHSLPILKRRLKELQAEKEQLVNDIEYYENVLQDTVSSISDIQSLQLGINLSLSADSVLSEYHSCKTYTDKILFIVKSPRKFGRELIEGSPDVISVITEFEELRRGEKLNRIKQTVQSTMSRLYEKGLLLKYRYVGTKGKYVTIHPDWLHLGEFKDEYREYVSKIEPVGNNDVEIKTPETIVTGADTEVKGL